MVFRDPLKYLSLTIPDNPALVDDSNVITFKQFDQQVCIFTTNLKESGISKNNRVIIVSTNCIELPIAIYALFRLGAVACLLSPRQPEDILAKQTSDLDCNYQIILGKKQTLPGLQTLIYNDLMENKAGLGFTAPDPSPDLSPDQPAVICFTSGSSGRPKAVLHSFGTLYNNAQGSNQNIAFTQGDSWLLSLPLYHVGGLGILFRSLASGGSVVIANPGEDFILLLNEHTITHISLVPTQLLRLLSKSSKKELLDINLKAVLVGGGTLPENLKAEVLAIGLPLYETYGMTEMGSQVATSPEPGTPMHLLNHCQMIISKESEILVKGSSLFSGYLTRSGLDSSLDKDGWYKTGDCGTIDEAGNVQVSGRIDNMFISGGENIYPEGIEAALLTNDAVDNAIVLPVDDDEYGQRPIAFIELNCQCDISEIMNDLTKIIPRYSIPVRFYRWPAKVNQSGIKNNRQFFENLLLDESKLKQF